jgi:uncharacterized protein
MKTAKFTTLGCALVMILSNITLARPSDGRIDSTKLSHEDEINAWHTKRIEGLKRPQGWLSLVALDWLNEGQNKLESLGTLTLDKGTVTFRVLPGVQAKVGGKPFTSGVLKTEGGKERPDRAEIGSKVFTIIRRGDRFAVRMWDSNAEVLQHFTGIDRFPVSRQWRIESRWEAYASPKAIKVASVIPGYLEDYTVPGMAVFSIGGREYKLEPVGSGNESLFFIFADETNGKESYGAGRFLYTDPPKDGKVIIDFNKAINPPCAFTPYATCPLPPASNSLPVRIEAGEKSFGDH